jgi:hypothetical protein
MKWFEDNSGVWWLRPVPESLMRELVVRRLHRRSETIKHLHNPAAVRHLFFWLYVVERNNYRLN